MGRGNAQYGMGRGNAQYGLWLRGEPGRRANKENDSTDEGNGLNNKHRDEGAVREMRIQKVQLN